MSSRTVDIVVRVNDRATAAAAQIASKFAAIEQRIQRTANRLKSFAGGRYQATISLIDRVTPQGSKINSVLKSLAGKAYNVSLRLTDSISGKLQSINASLGRLTNKVVTVTINAKDNVSKKLSGLTDGLMTGAGGMGVGMLGVGGIGYGISNAIQSSMAFEKQMSNVQAIRQLSKDSDEMKALVRQSKDLGAQTAFTREEVGQAQYYQALAGWSTQQILAGTPHMLNLASAGNVDLKSASDITTDAMTAFQLKAGDTFTNAAGEQINATKYFVDMFAKLQASSNTDILQAGEAFKHSAATIGSMFSDVEGQEGVQMRMEAARQAMIMVGLQANAGIKGSMAGTGINTLFSRLGGGNSNALLAERILGLEHAKDGQFLMPLDYIKGFQRKMKEGMSVDEFYAVAEDLSGEKIDRRTRAKLDSTINNALKNGGKLGSEDVNKLASMMAGLDNAPKLLAMLSQDIDAFEAQMMSVEGTAEGMAITQMDNLAGEFTRLGSAWDAFQQDLFMGTAGDGLRNFVKTLTEIVTEANHLFSDGIQIGDFGKLIGDVVGRLKDKFMELDGIGSVLAGGVLMGALGKIASKVKSVTSGVQDILRGTSSTSTRTGTVSAGQSVGSMTVHAGVVNVNGKVGGKGVGNQSIIDNYNRTKERIRGGGTPPPTSSRFSGMKSAGVIGGATALAFGVMDVMGAQEHSKVRLGEANEAVEYHQNALKDLYKSGKATSEQIAAAQQNIKDAQAFVDRTKQMNSEDEIRAGTAAVGSTIGAAIGTAVGTLGGPVGMAIGGTVGSVLGDVIGQKVADWKIERDKNKPAAESKNFFGEDKPLSLKERVYGISDEEQSARTAAKFKAVDEKLGTSSPFKFNDTQQAAQDFYKNGGNVRMIENPETVNFDLGARIAELKNSLTALTTNDSLVELSKNATNGNSLDKSAQVVTGYEQAVDAGVDGLNRLKGSIEEFKEGVTPTSGTSFEMSGDMSTGYGQAVGVPEVNFSEMFESGLQQASDFTNSLFESLSLAALEAEFAMTDLGNSISQGLNSAFESVGEIFSSLGEQIAAGLEGAASAAEGALSTISSTFDSAREGIVSAWSELPGLFGGIFDGLGGVAASAGSAILSGLTSVCGAVIGAWEGVASTVSGIIASIQSAAANVASLIPSIGGGGVGKAEGGFVSAETHFYAGEHGDEVVIPLSSSQRNRALDLYEKTGLILNGGQANFAGEEIQPDTPTISDNVPNVPAVQPIQNEMPATQSSTGDIQMGGVNVTFNITGENSQDIMEEIRNHLAELTDSIASKLSEQIASVHANQPLENN